MDESYKTLEPVRLQRIMMEITCVWPKPNPKLSYTLRYYFYTGIFTIFLYSLFYELYISRKSYSDFSQILALATSPTSYFVKEIIYNLNKSTKLELLNHLRSPVFQNYPSHLTKYMDRATRISSLTTKVFQFICIMVIALYSLKPLFIRDHRELPVNITMNLDGDWYYLLYFMQMWSLLYCVINNSCLDTLAAGLMSIATAQFSILHDRLVDLIDQPFGDDDDDDKVAFEARLKVILKSCIHQHVATIRLVELVEQVFSMAFLVQFMHSVIVVCNIGFQLAIMSLSTIQLAIMVFYFMAMTNQLAIYCWFGNEVTFISSKIGDACYLSKWYECSPSIRKYLFIIMERSKRPVCLTAGKFINLSLAAFASVIRSSYSYFALMQRLYAK